MADLTTPKGRHMEYLRGDPDALAGEVTRLKNVASTISQLVDLLGQVNDKRNSQSHRIDDIRDAAKNAKEVLAKAHDIYNKTGWALGDYQTQLATSISAAKTAVDGAQQVLPTVNSREAAVQHAQQQQANPPEGTDPASIDTAGPQQSLNAANETLNTYKRNYDTAKDDLDSAANTARSRIRSAVDDNPLKDSWWDNLAGVLDALSSVIGIVIMVLAVIAIFATGGLALILFAVITALTLVNLVIHASLLIGGKGNWMDLAMDVVGLIPFGRLFGEGGTLAVRLSRTGSEMWNNVRIVPTLNSMRASRAALETAIAQNALSRSGNYWANWAAQASRAAEEARAGTSVIDALRAGGSREAAIARNILDALPGRNAPARAAIEAARSATGYQGTSQAVAFVGNQAAGTGYFGHAAASGDDWTVNQIVQLFQHEPTTAELKARVLAPQMTNPVRPDADPYA